MTCGFYEYTEALSVLFILLLTAMLIIWLSPKAMKSLATLLMRRAMALKTSRERYHLSWQSSSKSEACLEEVPVEYTIQEPKLDLGSWKDILNGSTTESNS